ncbi:hypothetical protein JIG36_28325 [Actinoplanes sp. LDG1-06]|uniref:Gram-positive cocci surface proteins LPxTG domain-containing protein n=1 Tax=Paractinoplanes ovalisporus TaxID=2810368 RepID=A0ABS2AHZ9_9ACTN|nr:hypothetical protein [Actinoplanes ovalisporus]MBM2619466.1 hypothetical protein [Actinoplanes ovalisporus]
MKHLVRALGVAAVTAAAVTLPSTAWAADPEPQLVALTNASAGDTQTYRPFQKGQSLPVAAGIANVGAAPVRGVVVDLYVSGEMELPRDWTNCEYYGDDIVQGAWCEFDTELQAATSYLLNPLSIAGQADASRIKYPHWLLFSWYPKSYAEENGGIRNLARNASSQEGRDPVRGTKLPLTLQKADLPVPTGEGSNNPRGSIAYYFVLKPPASPTATPTTSPTPTVVPPGNPTSPVPSDSPGPTETVTTDPTPTATSASPSATAAPATTTDASTGQGGGGGLALTGANTALVAGGGLVLLLAGAGGFLFTRRRRTKFVA